MSRQVSKKSQKALPSHDPIDELCVIAMTDDFEDAASFLASKNRFNLDHAAKMRFYALYQQATVGPVTGAKPHFKTPVERSKWTAWKALGSMTKDEACVAYINEIETMCPEWRQESLALQLESSEEEDDAAETNAKAADNDTPVNSDAASDSQGKRVKKKKKKKNKNKKKGTDASSSSAAAGGAAGGAAAGGQGGAPGGKGGMMQSLTSRPVYEEKEQAAVVLNQWHFARQNDWNQLKRLLTSDKEINAADSDGLTCLHYAVDGEHVDLVKSLLELRASANVKDPDGATPLHYACVVDSEVLARVLIEGGADAHITDADGVDCMEMAAKLGLLLTG